MSHTVKIDIETVVNSKELTKLSSEIENLRNNKIEIPVSTDSISKLGSEILSANTGVSSFSKSIQSSFSSASRDVGSFTRTVGTVPSNLNNVEKSGRGAFSTISGAIKSAGQQLTGFSSGLSGLERGMGMFAGGVGAVGIGELTIGKGMDKEVNRMLVKSMAGGDEKKVTELWNTVDDATNNSLTNIYDLVPAMQLFSNTSGASTDQLKEFASVGADVGTMAEVMGKGHSTQFVLEGLAYGLDGAFARLDHLGITEEALMNTGLWSGKKEDIDGYLAAIDEVSGVSEELMKTTRGTFTLLWKQFTKAGSEIGENHINPILQGITKWMIKLNATGNNFPIKAIIGLGGALSGLAIGIPILRSIVNSFKSLKSAIWAISGGIKRLGRTMIGGLRGRGWRNSWRQSAGRKHNMGTVTVTPKCVPLCNKSVKAVGPVKTTPTNVATGGGKTPKGRGGAASLAATAAGPIAVGALTIFLTMDDVGGPTAKEIEEHVAAVESGLIEAEGMLTSHTNYTNHWKEQENLKQDRHNSYLNTSWTNNLSQMSGSFDFWRGLKPPQMGGLNTNLSGIWTDGMTLHDIKWQDWKKTKPGDMYSLGDTLSTAWTNTIGGLRSAWNSFINWVYRNPAPTGGTGREEHWSNYHINPFAAVPAGGFVGDNMPFVGDESDSGSYLSAKSPRNMGRRRYNVDKKVKNNDGRTNYNTFNFNSLITEKDVAKTIMDVVNTDMRRRKDRTRRNPWD